MKKIITAMGNSVLNNELTKYADYDVICDDLVCQEEVIQNIKGQQLDTLIISGLLQGQWNLEEFVEKIKKINSRTRIVVVTDEIDKSLRKILEENGVLDVFIDSTVEISDIIDAINREDPIKKKYEMACEPEENYEVQEVKNAIEKLSKKQKNTKTAKTPKVAREMQTLIVEKAVQKQEVITFSGTSGSGKSTIAINFARILSQKSGSKILVIDLDTLNGNLDEIAGINKISENIELAIDEDKKSGINYASELIMKNRFDANVLNELVIDANGIDVLTGNTSLHYCQNVLSEECYEKILTSAKEKYDFIILDTSSNIFLDSTRWALQSANRVLFVTEGNFISMKKAKQFLDVVINIWGILKDKFEIIINKKQNNNLEVDVVSQILNDMKVVGEIKLNEESNTISYENILANINYIPKKSLMEKFEEMKKNFFIIPSKEVTRNAN